MEPESEISAPPMSSDEAETYRCRRANVWTVAHELFREWSEPLDREADVRKVARKALLAARIFVDEINEQLPEIEATDASVVTKP